jgi:hypothetical protein
MQGGNVNDPPAMRLSSSDLMQLFTTGDSSDEDGDEADAAPVRLSTGVIPPAPMEDEPDTPRREMTSALDDEDNVVDLSRTAAAVAHGEVEELGAADGYNTFGASSPTSPEQGTGSADA